MSILRLLIRIPVFQAVFLALLISGCGALPITLAGALPMMVSGASGGVAYTFTNTAYKTFSYPIEAVEGSLHAALIKMDIKEVDSKVKDDGIDITAKTRKLKIYIWIEHVTAFTTRVKVNAKRGAFLKDKATATEIIVQIEKELEMGTPADNMFRKQVPETQMGGSIIAL